MVFLPLSTSTQPRAIGSSLVVLLYLNCCNLPLQVDGTTSQGSSALMLACKRKHIEVVEALLVAGADMHLRDRRSRTARETAEKREFSSIVGLLNNQAQVRGLENYIKYAIFFL